MGQKGPDSLWAVSTSCRTAIRHLKGLTTTLGRFAHNLPTIPSKPPRSWSTNVMTVALEFKGRPTHLRRRKNSSPSGPTFEHLIRCLVRCLEARVEPVDLS